MSPAQAQISLTDCLACSGCVTSAEAVLVSLQSHSEVLNALDSQPALNLYQVPADAASGAGRAFVASVSPQVRASLAATYNVSQLEAGWMIDQLLGGSEGLARGGRHGNKFSWVVDTNAMREAVLVLGADEVMYSISPNKPIEAEDKNGDANFRPKNPILTSACPGWICYAEKTHPHILPHLSRLKSPQALTGTLLKTVLSHCLGIRPDQIWHVAIMPCFDKKLEASREELTDIYWRPDHSGLEPPVRDVDCVITSKELLMLADTRGINFSSLPRQPLPVTIPFPDPVISKFLFPKATTQRNPAAKWPSRTRRSPQSNLAAGTSGGYLHHILSAQQSLHPGSILRTTPGRNADVVEYALLTCTSPEFDTPIFKAARYYGFRNIQNLVRKLKPARQSRLPGGKVRKGVGGGSGVDYAYVEVMACPGGCTNGGGQLKVKDIPAETQSQTTTTTSQNDWLAKVDEAYFSMEEEDEEGQEEDSFPSSSTSEIEHPEPPDLDIINGISTTEIRRVLEHWSTLVNIAQEKLVRTGYRVVVSDVGKTDVGQTTRVAELAGKIGGGW